MIRLLIVLLMPVVLLAGHLTAGAGPDAAESGAQNWPTVEIPASLEVTGIQPSAARAGGNPKLDGALGALVEAGEDRAAVAEAAGLRLEDGRVQVHLMVDPRNEAAARAAVAGANGEVTGTFEGVLQAWLPPDQLTTVASQPAIDAIRPPDTAVLADIDTLSATSEGVAVANANVWHDAGWRGQGIRIAVIDAGFQGYAALLGSDLPGEVTVKNFVDGQPDSEVGATTRHGTACAEIIHDMAPSAQLYLLKISTDVDLNEAVDYAISQGVDIISTSLTFLNVTPGDGTGRFATMAQRARDAGILWVTAAGNYRETHWSGAFTDSDGDGLHEYAPGVEVNAFGPGNNTAFLIPANQAITASIRWDDWTAINQDYRLLLVRYNTSTGQYEIVGGNNNPQTGLPGQRPTERLTHVTSGAPAVYGVVIQRVSGARAVHLHLLTPNRELDRRVPAMSLGNLADVASIFTVAAVDVRAPFVREDYSSEGPTNGPGGVAGGGQLKPDLAAFANVATAIYSPGRFNGTSAATPHVAGAAALVINAYPNAQPEEVRDYLQTRAIDQGSVGADTQFGFGRLHMGAPPGPMNNAYRLFAPYVVVDYSVNRFMDRP